MSQTKFYDIHFHAMDLSHANITAFISRLISDEKIFLNKDFINGILKKHLPFWKKAALAFIPNSKLSNIIIKKLKNGNPLQKVNNVRNLLSFMESSILYDFLIVDYFLKNKEKIVDPDNTFRTGTMEYNKIVICPLIMDFGYKNIYEPGIFYNVPPQKPITSQISDLFKAIHTYYQNEIEITGNNSTVKFNIHKTDVDKRKKLFEIYPFMGINTKNYTFSEIEKMMNKYFSAFDKSDTPEQRQKKLFDKMGEFEGDLNDQTYDYNNIFTGIKVYPPLGFEPWPDDSEEREKVKLLYGFCVEKRIPVITHCSTGGFKTTNKSFEYTDPGNQWSKVLEKYPALKIDFAHFGSGNQEWRDVIINHIENSGFENVYTDFSCNTNGDEYYKQLGNIINKSSPSKLKERVMFGSDFMINLIWLKSYNEYLKGFISTKHFDTDTKYKFTNSNPGRFLFG